MFDYSRKPVKWQVGNFSLLIQKSPKICLKYNELIELNEYNKSAIYSLPFGRGRGGLLHPPDTPDTLLRRVQGLCLSAL